MKVGDLVRLAHISVENGAYVNPGATGIITQEDRTRGIVFVHFRDKAHWIICSWVEVINESR